MMRAPMPMSLSTKNIRDSNIFSWIRIVPSAWVAATSAMLMRSGGKPGQGASSILGIEPPRSGTTFRSWPEGTRMFSPSVSQWMPSRPKAMRVMRRKPGAASSISRSPPVTAASPMKEPTSM